MGRRKKSKKDTPDVSTVLTDIARGIYDQINGGRIPELEVPSRTKSNIVFNEKLGVWKYGTNKVARSAKTLGGAY